MCVSPVRIKNPNFGRKVEPGSPFQLKDCTSLYIDVPCGFCSECILSRQMQLVQRVQMESLKNHIFFATLTYQESEIPIVSTSTGYDIKYADISDVQNMMKRLRKSEAFGRPFRYLAVSEFGSKHGRPHFHILFLLPKYKDDDHSTLLNLERLVRHSVFSEWRRNYGSTRSPIWRPLSEYVERYRNGRLYRSYDCHYVQPYEGDKSYLSVAFYVLKYMLKPSKRAVRLQQALRLNLPEDEYEYIWSLCRPRVVKSLDFGQSKSSDVRRYIRSGVLRSCEEGMPFPCFYNLDTGDSFPLSRFYKSKSGLLTLEDALRFRENARVKSLDNSDPRDPVHRSIIEKKEHDFQKKVFAAFCHGSDDVLDF